MRTDELIASLAQDAKPVRTMPAPAVQALVLIGAALVVSVAGAWLMGFRDDLAVKLAERRFLMINTMLLLTLGLTALAMGALALPRRRHWRIPVTLGVVLLAVLIGMFLMRWPWLYGMDQLFWWGSGCYCTVRTLAMGAVPGGVGLWLHRHGAPTQPAISGGLIGAATGAQGANAMGWACDIDEPLHLLLWHFLVPVTLLTLAGAWAGRRWLRW